MTPKIVAWTPETFRLSPVLDMLNVRYVVFRGDSAAADRQLARFRPAPITG